MSINISKQRKVNFKSPKSIVYIAVIILFSATLFFASDIVSLLISNSVRKKNVDIDIFKKDSALYSIDLAEFYDDFYGNVHFAGWAFCETLEDNSEKEIWFVFESDRATYMYKNELQVSEIGHVFKSTHDIRGKNHRFRGTASTAVMKNGLYKLYIFCKENDENYGLVDTGRMMRKDGNSISQSIWESSICDVVETNNGANTKCNIDSTSVTDNGYFQINGWAFEDGYDTAYQSVYVRLTYDDGKTGTYDTMNVSRHDIGNAFGSNLYNSSGFQALIPASELSKGDIMVEILVSNGKNVYLASQTYKYSSDLSTVEKLPDTTNKKNVSTEAEIDTKKISEDSTVKYSIDSCMAAESLSVNGWAFISDAESSGTKIYLVVTSVNDTTRVYTTQKVSRPDVAKAYKSDLYTESGFTAVIPLDEIADGENTITVIADNGQMLKASSSYTFNNEAEDKSSAKPH